MDQIFSFTEGAVTISRIVEQPLHFTLDRLFPEADCTALTPQELSFCAREDGGAFGLTMSIHSWAVRTPECVALVELATGNNKSRPASPFWDNLQTPFMDRLAAAGVQPGDVDHAFITHVHTDHIGWCTRLEGERWIPAFPSCTYYFSRMEQELWATLPERRVMFEDSILPVLESGQVQLIDDSTITKMPAGFSWIKTPGHTPDHMALLLETGARPVIFGGDCMHHPLQVAHPEWNSMFCMDGQAARESRMKLLNLAADSEAIYCSTHFPLSGAGTVRRITHGFTWEWL